MRFPVDAHILIIEFKGIFLLKNNTCSQICHFICTNFDSMCYFQVVNYSKINQLATEANVAINFELPMI